MPMRGLSRTTLREQVLKQLRDAILSGELPVGAHLNEVELASRLTVSRGTVREALRTLEQAGLAESADRGRLIVRRLSKRDVRELYQVRSFLECGAALAVAHDTNRNSLVKQLTKALPPATTRDFESALRADLAFHQKLCDLADNALLVHQWSSLEHQIRVVTCAGAATDDGVVPDIMLRANHLPLVEALGQQDELAIIHVFNAHMDGAAAYWTNRIPEPATH